MATIAKYLLVVAAILFASLAFGQDAAAPGPGPEYAANGQLKFPEKYREWIYLTSGFDMSYGPNIKLHSMFDNVFVNPAAYKAFLKTGTWPDKTVMVLEQRPAESKGSINQSGHFQGSDVMALEVHAKDEARFPGKWAFFAFGNSKADGKLLPSSATCYSCHSEHGAVDTTFVQFYPTLLEVARKKGSLSPSYLKETAAGR